MTKSVPVTGKSTAAVAMSEAQVNVGRKYKSRKERPCDACRKRKICCTRDAYEKACSLCKTRGETCKYILPPNVRRNRQPVNSSTNTTSSRNNMGSTSTSSSSSPTVSGGLSVPPRPCNGNGERDGKGNWEAREWICQFVGWSGDQDPFVLRHCSFNALNCYKASDWAILRIKGDNEIPLHFTVVPDTHLDARPHYYPTTDTEAIIHPHREDLLRTYFEIIHTSYPLLDPSRFTTAPRTGDPLLAVMYNLAAPFCPNTPPHFPQLSDFVQQALPIETRHPRLETIEATLLHLQRHTHFHHPPNSPVLPGLYSELGSLIGIAHDLGLNLDPTTWSLSQSDMNRRIRIWWGIYIQDKWSALGLGRPSYLHEENYSVPLPVLGNFVNEGNVGELGMGREEVEGAMGFIAMASLSVILSDILNTFYTLKSLERIRTLPMEVLFGLMEEFEERLRVFQEVHLRRIFHYGGNEGKVDSRGTLVLAFYTLEIVLYRAILRVLPMGCQGFLGVRERARVVLCRVVGFVEKLGTERGRAFWWSPMTRINFALAGTFMFFQLLTSITTHDIEFWSDTISHYRSILRMHSLSFDMTKLACTRMDLLAAGMGVDPPAPGEGGDRLGAGMGGGGEELGVEGFDGGKFLGVNDGARREGKMLALTPGSAEEWIARQGHEGMLLC